MAAQCKATAKSTGQQCARQAIEGGTVCRVHGGATKLARAKAERNLQEAEAARQVATLGLPVDITPTDALLQEVQWTAGHVQWLRTKVQELDEQALVWGTTAESEKDSDKNGRETSYTVSAKPSVWYSLYQAERAHLVAVCTAALKAGVEERKVRLAEQQGDLVVAVIRRILDGLYASLLAAGLTADQLADAWDAAIADVVPRELRAIAGGGA